MAFKRSAVRSRYSPPDKKPQGHRSCGFLHIPRGGYLYGRIYSPFRIIEKKDSEQAPSPYKAAFNCFCSTALLYALFVEIVNYFFREVICCQNHLVLLIILFMFLHANFVEVVKFSECLTSCWFWNY